MKKLLTILAIFLFSIVGVFAADQTLVAGHIYDMENNPIDNAYVRVTCYHNEIPTIQDTYTLENGAYSVLFSDRDCTGGDNVEIYAEAEGIGSGTAWGVVNPDKTAELNVSFVNLSIPEFGLIGGVIGILGSSAGFLFLRRKHN